ncbi:hypothetical protein T440DRAFT_536629 [Plenodomus tracheiphilus IPT5]|uniref:C2H2-type domain-containing protein n=1 Tax=Plenodomus tracheiphilus IPT5 TaxID=1408161 RepID=A0A6A7B1V8_9PLEO|nr:hypothetical protein T440DRAFT_536629 [Plenodomus tracheiphilus IPT5]
MFCGKHVKLDIFPSTDEIISCLDETQLPHQLLSTTRKPGKLRIVPHVTPYYRPPLETGTTRTVDPIRPKQEPISPAMSGYGYSSSDQAGYNYAPAYQATVPQYTQTQINQYYVEYQCYPQQPYNIIPDYYVQAPAVAQPTYQQPLAGAGYGAHWQAQADSNDLNTSQGPTRSNSRTRTWTCDIASCTSSANFTRLADLQRHQSTVHGVGTPEYPCTVPRCNRIADKGFTRRDHLVEHLRNFHHMDIPKRRPGERSAFPFGWPEGGASQGSSSGTIGRGEHVRGTRARDRVGRITKPSRRGGRGGGRSRGASRITGGARGSVGSAGLQDSGQDHDLDRLAESESLRNSNLTGDADTVGPQGPVTLDDLLALGDFPV